MAGKDYRDMISTAPVSNGGRAGVIGFGLIPDPQAVLLLAACRSAKSDRLLGN